MFSSFSKEQQWANERTHTAVGECTCTELQGYSVITVHFGHEDASWLMLLVAKNKSWLRQLPPCNVYSMGQCNYKLQDVCLHILHTYSCMNLDCVGWSHHMWLSGNIVSFAPEALHAFMDLNICSDVGQNALMWFAHISNAFSVID